MSEAPETETKSAFARRLGCSPAWVSQLVKRGLPLTEDGARVRIVEALAWIKGNILTKEDEGGDPTDLSTAKLRLVLAQARRAEYALEVERGRYVERDEARRAVRAFGRGLRDLILNFPNRYGAAMAAELNVDPAAFIALVDARLREMLLEGVKIKPPYHDPTEKVIEVET